VTPAQRQTNSALKWLKESVKDASSIAKLIEEFLASPASADMPASSAAAIEGFAVALRKSAKRCAYHGLGMSVQELLPLKPKE
jgi:hypothetical protein